jgi:hypothetical protein
MVWNIEVCEPVSKVGEVWKVEVVQMASDNFALGMMKRVGN